MRALMTKGVLCVIFVELKKRFLFSWLIIHCFLPRHIVVNLEKSAFDEHAPTYLRAYISYIQVKHDF